MLGAWSRRGAVSKVVLPLSSLTRVRDSLADTEGEVRFALEFGRDALQVPYVELRIDAELPLVCQRSLQRFLLPVQIVQRLGLIRDEARGERRCRKATSRCWCRKTASCGRWSWSRTN